MKPKAAKVVIKSGVLWKTKQNEPIEQIYWEFQVDVDSVFQYQPIFVKQSANTRHSFGKYSTAVFFKGNEPQYFDLY